MVEKVDWVYPVAAPPPPNLDELTVGPNFSLTCTAIGLTPCPLLLDPMPLLAPLAKIGMVVIEVDVATKPASGERLLTTYRGD